MSDDLVKWLRDLGDHAAFESHMHHTAADRIQELEAQRKKTYEALLKVTRLEAKLAKAVEEAEKYQQAFAAQSRKLQAVLHIDGVRATLAELTGGKDE